MNFRFLYLIYGFVIILLLDSCARQGRPTGGEKDLDAPILISADPEHESTNFNTDKIRINFNEYIKLKDLNKQLVISPPMDNQPIITPVGTASKFVNIKILDTLKENTTYTFNFGNSVEDNNEGNPLEQFKYVFSTLPDSQQGRILTNNYLTYVSEVSARSFLISKATVLYVSERSTKSLVVNKYFVLRVRKVNKVALCENVPCVACPKSQQGCFCEHCCV